MALIDTTWYINGGNGTTTGFWAVSKWLANHAYANGAFMRANTAPAVGSERVFVCTVAGTSNTTTEPTWIVTRGGQTVDNTAHWQECTGQPALNGDNINAAQWVASQAWTLGQVIYDSVANSVQICSTAGTGNTGLPTFSNTAGTVSSDGATVKWTSLGAFQPSTNLWLTPFPRLQSAFTATWGAANNQFFVANTHTETQASAISFTAVGTTVNPITVLCVPTSAAPPTSLSTGATISTTGTSALTFAGTSNFMASALPGFQFNASSAASASSLIFWSGGQAQFQKFNNCTFKLNATAAANRFEFPSATTVNSAAAFFYNCSFLFTATSQGFQGAPAPVADFRMYGGSIANTGSIPASLFLTAEFDQFYGEGIDLSTLTGILFAANGTFVIKDCKLNASAVVANTSGTSPGSRVDIVRCDSGATNYRTERYAFQGQQRTSNAIARSNGATDNITAISWIGTTVSTANGCNWNFPYEFIPISIFNSVISTNRQVTLYGMSNTTTLPNNDQWWFDCQYLGSTTTPLGNYLTGTKASSVSANTALTADTSRWDTFANSSYAYHTAKAYTAFTGIVNTTSIMTQANLVWFCTTSGTSNASSANTSFTGASDGATVIDGTAHFQSGMRFSQTLTLSAVQPGQTGYLSVYPKQGLAASAFFVDPLIVLG